MIQKGNTNGYVEELLKFEADKYRLYPSDKVWDNIRQELHADTKWPALVIIFVSIVLALSISTVINYPTDKLSNASIVSIKITAPKINNTPTFYANNFYAQKVEKNQTNTSKSFAVKSIQNKLDNADDPLESALPIKLQQTKEFENFNKQISSKELQESVVVKEDKTIENFTTIPSNFNFKNNNINTDLLVSDAGTLNLQKQISNKKVNGKWKVQYYATLSKSYRVLDDDKSRSRYTNNPIDRQALTKNLNDIVRHKPLLGLELGANFLYPLTKNLFVKTGIQFDIRQYNIDAYNAYGAANISYVNNNQLITYSTISSLSTNNENAIGAKTNIYNKLYQISIPIGLEWMVVDGKNYGLSLSGAIEPTIALNKDAYLVSTDYKYYTDGAPFFRRFNINASTGMYFYVKAKNSKWFIGPEVRFQQLPTYNDLYPIKEYRIDYGIKIGITKPLH